MELYRQGNSQFVDEDYDDAIESYSSAIKEMPNSPTPLLNRAAAFIKLKKFESALEDLNKALEFNDGLELAYLRKGLSLFELQDFKTAKSAFETGLKLRKAAASRRDVNVYIRYIRKCDAELSDVETITPPQVTAPSIAQPTVAPVAKQTLTLPVRYQYYQSDSTMNISVLAKNLAPEDVIVDIQSERLRVVIKYKTFAGEDKEEVVIDKELYGSVDVAKSNYVVLKPKVEITLVKMDKEVWPGLESTGQARLPRPVPVVTPIADESPVDMDVDGGGDITVKNKRPKPYASSRDWDKVGNEISKELEKEKKDVDDGGNSVFAALYQGLDPDAQRAMKKSFQTSGGTVLSTNWNEVKNTDYEAPEHRQAPKGMEWRNWEGDKLKQKEG